MRTDIPCLPVSIIGGMFKIFIPDFALIMEIQFIEVFDGTHFQIKIIYITNVDVVAHQRILLSRRISRMIKKIKKAEIIHKKKSTTMISIITFKLIGNRCLR